MEVEGTDNTAEEVEVSDSRVVLFGREDRERALVQWLKCHVRHYLPFQSASSQVLALLAMPASC